jgi:acyl-CoA thioester hydrolase
MTKNTTFLHQARVYYEDTDVAGIVYYANYLRYIERARSEWIRTLDIDQSALIEQGFAFAVTKVNINYLKPARFNDLLEIVTTIKKAGRASLLFEQVVRNKDEPALINCKADVKVAFINTKTMKPIALPARIMEEFSQ